MKKFKCKCGCVDFKMDVEAHDTDVYGITVDMTCNVELVELLKEYCGESEYHNSIGCFDCGSEYSLFSLKPLAECKEYKETKRMKNYVEGGGVSCPFCGTQNIEGQNLEFDASCIWQKVICGDCGKRWTDTYSLVEAEEDA